MTTLYTARAHVTSGRDGSVRTDDSKLELRLAFPKSLGGNGTNREQLFAARYGACFGSTLATIAKAEGKALRDAHVDSEVDMNEEGGSYQLSVRLSVRAEGVDGTTLQGLVEKARSACPYSRATRGNVATTVTIAGAAR